MQGGQEGGRAQLRKPDELGPVGRRERDGGWGSTGAAASMRDSVRGLTVCSCGHLERVVTSEIRTDVLMW